MSFVTTGGYGSYAEYALVDVPFLFPVPEDVSLPAAASSFINPGTVVGFLEIVRQHKATAVV